MGHHITALIGARSTPAGLTEWFGPPDPVEVAFGLVVLGLDERRLDALALSAEAVFEGFTFLTPALSAAIGGALNAGSALYVETAYFGGTGDQGAALFENGAPVWRATETTAGPAPSPISRGLARLGVIPADGRDAFDTIGLGGFRSLEDLGLA